MSLWLHTKTGKRKHAPANRFSPGGLWQTYANTGTNNMLGSLIWGKVQLQHYPKTVHESVLHLIHKPKQTNNPLLDI